MNIFTGYCSKCLKFLQFYFQIVFAMSNAQRGRPAKKRRGPAPEIAGSEGDAVGFRHLSINSKRTYRKGTSSGSAQSPETAPGDHDLPGSKGRPPLDPEKGPMRESSLQKRRAELSKNWRQKREEERRKDHLSEVRRQAASRRWSKEYEDMEGDEVEQPDKEPSERTAFRIKSEFSDALPSSLKCQMEVLVKVVEDGLLPELSVVDQVRAAQETPGRSLRRYHAKLMEFVEKVKEKYASFSHTLLLSWAQTLIKADRQMFAMNNLCFLNPKDIPQPVLAQLASDQIREDMLSKKWGKLLHNFTITHAVRVCKEVTYWKDHKHGEVAGLAAAIGASHKFVAKVLSAVEKGKESDLYRRQVRKDSLRGSPVMDELVLFLQEERNSRSCPGSTVSVAYGVRRDKYLLCDSKKNLLKLFKQENPLIKFKTSVMLKSWPRNFKTPTSRDRIRNACPVHSNFRRLLQALHLAGVGSNIARSCRAASALAMCDKADKVSLDPLTWSFDCASGQCQECPPLHLHVKEGVDASSTIVFTQWKKGPSGRPSIKTSINSLFQVSMSVSTAMETLQEQSLALKRHIFVAYNQWRAKKLAEENLRCDTLLVVEDYQQNLTVELAETTTSTVFGANVVNIAEFPAVVFYRQEEAEPVQKACITFFSDDLNHDHQQVQAFERRIVEIVKQRTGILFKKIIRFSDGCGAQFKSRFCVADLCQMSGEVLGLDPSQGGKVQAHFFASHEGKSDSDTAGSLEKLRAERILLRNTEMVVTNAAQLVAAIQGSAPPSEDSATAKYSFRIVEEMTALDRVASHLRPEIQVKGIRSLHCFSVQDGILKAKTVSCLTCLEYQEECEDCSSTPPLKTADQVLVALSLPPEEGGVEDPNDPEDEDEDQEGGLLEVEEEESESEEEDSDSEEETDEIEEGCYVWAPFGRRLYPAQVVSLSAIPQNLHRQMTTKRTGQIAVKWIGERDMTGQEVDRFSSVDTVRLKLLGDDAVDHSLARRCPMQYYQALNQALTPS